MPWLIFNIPILSHRRISYFCKGLRFLWLENGIRNQYLGIRCAHCYWHITASSPFQLTEQRNMYLDIYFFRVAFCYLFVTYHCMSLRAIILPLPNREWHGMGVKSTWANELITVKYFYYSEPTPGFAKKSIEILWTGSQEFQELKQLKLCSTDMSSRRIYLMNILLLGWQK